MYDIVNSNYNLISDRNAVNPKFNNRLFTIISKYGELSVKIGSIKTNINVNYSSDNTAIIWNSMIKPSKMVVNYSYFRGPDVCTNPSSTTYGIECIPDTYSDVNIEFSDNKIMVVSLARNSQFTVVNQKTIVRTKLHGAGKYQHDNLRVQPHTTFSTTSGYIINIKHPYLIISLYE